MRVAQSVPSNRRTSPVLLLVASAAALCSSCSTSGFAAAGSAVLVEGPLPFTAEVVDASGDRIVIPLTVCNAELGSVQGSITSRTYPDRLVWIEMSVVADGSVALTVGWETEVVEWSAARVHSAGGGTFEARPRWAGGEAGVVVFRCR